MLATSAGPISPGAGTAQDNCLMLPGCIKNLAVLLCGGGLIEACPDRTGLMPVFKRYYPNAISMP